MYFIKPDALIPHFDITPGMHVTDIGAGSGFFTLPLASAVGPYGRVYAIDKNEGQLAAIGREQKLRNWGHIHLIKADVSDESSIDLPEKADRVFLSNILFMVESKPALLSLAYQHLKPGGKMILIEAGSGSPIVPSELLLDEGYVSSIAELAGFIAEKRFHAGEYHYGIVFKKI